MTQNTNDSMRPLVVALTGGIASGKTAVSDRFAARGASVVDTDRIARDVVAPGSEGLQAVVSAFGDAVLADDGQLDRRALRDRVFADEDERRRLEGLLHPRIERAARSAIESSEGPYVVLVVPLLVESGLFGDADRVLVVDVPETVQLERLTARDEVSDEQARAALAAQADRRQRLAVADDVIENDGPIDALDAQVERLDRAYRRLARSRRSG